MIEQLEQRQLLATISVTTLVDEVTPNNGTVSLREAIRAMNAHNDLGDPNIAAQNPGTFGTNDTITVPAGTYTLTLTGAGEEAAATGDLDISDSLTINGAGAASTIIDGNAKDRIFDIDPGETTSTVTLHGLTIRNGANPTNSNFFAAGIYNQGTLTVTDCIITANVAQQDGGGIFSYGELTVINTTISGNHAGSGGAIGSGNALTITDSRLIDNTATGDNGAIYMFGRSGHLEMTRTTVSGNSAPDDGGFDVQFISGENTIVDSTISGNHATDGDAGGIEISSGASLIITNSTISGNTATGDGGGIDFESGTLRLFNTTIAFNSAGGEGGGVFEDGDDSTATGTIIAENTGGDCGGNGIVNTSNHNLDSDGTCFENSGGTGNLTANPLLGPLADNGGPTQTHALLSGSPAIDAGENPLALATDQRGPGFLRTVKQNDQPVDHTDIGAFEVQGVGCNITTLNEAGGLGTAVLQEDADHSGHSVLLVTGTNRGDVIVVEPRPSDSSQIRVKINGRLAGIFASEDVQRIVAYGLKGNDTIVVNATLAQSATLFGGNGNDNLYGGAASDQLAGEAGNDHLYGAAGADTLCGDEGNDFLYGGLGNDTLFGEAGNDRLFGEADDDVILGDDGNDFGYGGSGNDQVFGQAGNDQLFGDAGHDIVVGGSGNDKLFGSAGRDLLIGGDGSDQLFGETSDDILVAGSTTHDENQVALASIMAEWTSNGLYADRVKNIRFGTGVNGIFTLDHDTVMDDGLADVLRGDGSPDWFLFGTGDKVKDKTVGELVN